MSLHSTPNKAIRLAYGPETLQFGDLYLPTGAGPHSTIILIHGGYWRARYGLECKLMMPPSGSAND